MALGMPVETLLETPSWWVVVMSFDVSYSLTFFVYSGDTPGGSAEPGTGTLCKRSRCSSNVAIGNAQVVHLKEMRGWTRVKARNRELKVQMTFHHSLPGDLASPATCPAAISDPGNLTPRANLPLTFRGASGQLHTDRPTLNFGFASLYQVKECNLIPSNGYIGLFLRSQPHI